MGKDSLNVEIIRKALVSIDESYSNSIDDIELIDIYELEDEIILSAMKDIENKGGEDVI